MFNDDQHHKEQASEWKYTTLPMKQSCQNKQASKIELESDSSDNRKQRGPMINKPMRIQSEKQTVESLLDKQPVSQVGCRGEQEREGEAKDLKRLKGCHGFKICPQIL